MDGVYQKKQYAQYYFLSGLLEAFRLTNPLLQSFSFCFAENLLVEAYLKRKCLLCRRLLFFQVYYVMNLHQTCKYALTELYFLLRRNVCSLIRLEKQMPALPSLAFLLGSLYHEFATWEIIFCCDFLGFYFSYITCYIKKCVFLTEKAKDRRQIQSKNI